MHPKGTSTIVTAVVLMLGILGTIVERRLGAARSDQMGTRVKRQRFHRLHGA